MAHPFLLCRNRRLELISQMLRNASRPSRTGLCRESTPANAPGFPTETLGNDGICTRRDVYGIGSDSNERSITLDFLQRSIYCRGRPEFCAGAKRFRRAQECQVCPGGLLRTLGHSLRGIPIPGRYLRSGHWERRCSGNDRRVHP